jgi:uncharacterized metal-binding protein YceD (DUF177 family)
MSKEDLSERPWSLPVAVDQIPETGRHIDMSAGAPMREAIAKVAAVLGVGRLEAEFDLTRHVHDGVRVVGSVSATVVQQCVVSLEPMESRIEETFDLVFAPQGVAPLEADRAEEPVPPDEAPETLRDGVVDLGAIATEFLILGIDPYPRKPGAVFSAPQGKENVANHPFAALAALKKGKSGQDRG